MRRIMLLFAVVFFVSMSPNHAAADKEDRETDLSGKYAARGIGVDGKEYGATVTLEARGETYLIRWHFDDADFTGVGIRQKEVLSVGWLNHGKAGVVLYTIHGNKLEGRWADGSTDGKVCTENLVRE